MYRIFITGKKKEVFIVRGAMVCYDEPEILFEEGDDDNYKLLCRFYTSSDAMPNDYEASWDGQVVDTSSLELQKAMEGAYTVDYMDYSCEDLSGMFEVEIKLLNIADDPWWEEMDEDMLCDDAFYPYYIFKDGKTVAHKSLNADSAVETGLCKKSDLPGCYDEDEDYDGED